MTRFSVIIPAHNEAAVIGRCLRVLCLDADGNRIDRADDMEVIVACNGCSDDTAAIVRRFARDTGANVRVVETTSAGKVLALNLGDAAASHLPRLYVDADVRLPWADARALAEALHDEVAPVMAPSVRFDCTGRPWAVRAFYRVWSGLPYCRNLIGSGVYGLSAEGRRRFDTFPRITADDAFVRLTFPPAERETLRSATFVVEVPRTFWALIQIKARAHFGNREVAARYAETHAGAGREPGQRQALMRLARSARRWPDIAAYLTVRIAARLLAARRWHFGDHQAWERDESTRMEAVT
ncbi:MAG: glycosyltransferase family 2 protein [Planctomycetota bacterium]